MFRSMFGAITNAAETTYNSVVGPAVPPQHNRTSTSNDSKPIDHGTVIKKPDVDLLSFVTNPADAITQPAPPKPITHIPLRARNLSTYSKPKNEGQANVPKSAHDVDAIPRLKDKILQPHKIEYIKENPSNPYASELEAAAYELYYYLAPENAASTHALYKLNDNGDPVFTGVASKALLDAVSLAKKPLTLDDIKDPVIRKDLACIFASSHCAAEDDLHDGNIIWHKVDGRWRLARIDYDMSRWPIYYHFKNFTKPSSSYISFEHLWGRGTETLRTRNVNNYAPNPEDIINSPIFTSNVQFTHAHHHWVGRGLLRIKAQSNSSAEKKISSPSNKIAMEAPSTPQTLVFETLSKDSDYRNEIFIIYLKYILSDAEFHDRNNRLHVRENITHERKNILSMMYDYEENRIRQFRYVLKCMPEFQDFLQNHGENALVNIKLDMQTRKENLVRKEVKNKRLLDELKEDLATATKRKNEGEITRLTSAIERREKKCVTYDQLLRTYIINPATFDERYELLKKEIIEDNIKKQPKPIDDGFVKIPEIEEIASTSLPNISYMKNSLWNENKESNTITRRHSTTDLQSMPQLNSRISPKNGYESN